MKFEYMIENRRSFMDADDLDRYGNAGWELAAVTNNDGFLAYYFKRALIV